ncbi:hypothetical protein ICN42_04030 [Polynucleobacter sp. 71A-WALBACH]|uniref:hypothetical protein n=1 Tax=Polynucleobacter sp. 71A-WALBACH TaxID=2689097 RepID=UPI001C0B7206|nr:hypothetical protein [Polynucleobacter sp. 71A-WALBACH]MBU3593262.1 hypothetical protein [Polynucleobacter sp. 71A-WALBACH]
MSKAIYVGAIANLAARLTGLVASFLNVLLLGRLLNADEFGIWAWLFAIFSLITAQDFGYISAMRVRIGKNLGPGNSAENKALYATTFLMTVVILLLIAFGVLVYSTLHTETKDHASLRNIAIICSSITILGTVSAQSLLAHLETSIVGYIEAARSIVQISIFSAAYFFNWSLTALVIYFFLSAMLYVPLVGKIFLLTTGWTSAEILKITIAHFQKTKLIALSLLKEGWVLWIVQIVMVMLLGSDVYLAGFFLAPEDVAKVSVISRFQLLGVGLLAAALIPVIANFVAHLGKITKSSVMHKIHQGYLIFFAVGLFYAVVFTFIGQPVAQLWSHIYIDKPFVFSLSGLLLFLTLSATLMQIFIQFSEVSKALAVWLAPLIAIKIFLSQFLSSHFGYSGIFMASIVTVALFLMLSYSLLFRQGLYERLCSAQ